MSTSSLDLLWVDPFLDDVLKRWREAADNADGLFHPALDRQWRRHDDGTRTLVSQCRLIYNFARACERYRAKSERAEGEREKWAEIARRGIAALRRSFSSGQAGGWIWSCDAAGAALNDDFDAYGHAFVILALATGAAILQDDECRDGALQTWRFMKERFRDPHGGLIWHIGRDGAIKEASRSQNPVMHTFEALLALAPLDESGEVARDAAQVWRFIHARRLANGALPEWYDSAWQPLETGRGGIDIGHQFEWAFLLSEAHALGIRSEANLLDEGRVFLEIGLNWGFDATEGGVFNEATPGGALKSQNKGWWQQCEAIRALHRFASRHGEQNSAAPLQKCLDFARRRFVDDEFGGWYSNPPGLGGAPNFDKGNIYKLDYHVVNMCLELLR